MLVIGKALGLFIIAAMCEISGAYLIWQWLRGGKPLGIALLGVAALALYGAIQTAQTFSFGRTFASYGGIFILIALLWGWGIDGTLPDRWDWIGVGICLLGVLVIIGAPRS